MRLLLVFTFFISVSIQLSAQSKRAVKYFTHAREDVAQNQYSSALRNLKKALDDSPDYLDALLFIADLHRNMGEVEKSLTYYEKAMANNPPYYVNLFYGEALFEAGRYSESIQFLNRYIQSPEANPKYIEQANKILGNARFAENARANPKEFNPRNLGPKVNSRDMEYFPSISADGRTLVFTHRAMEGDRQDEDFYVSYRDSISGEWSKAQPLQGMLNTTLNEGAQSITADGNVIFFAACERTEGYGSCDLYYSFKTRDGKWSKAINLGDSINTRVWESQPSISSDGRTLYFVRGGSSISKNIDIWYSRLRDDNRWSKAKRIPGKVNGEGQESSPFIHFDNQNLFFSSNSHPGMGNLDFFVSKRQADGSWGAPQNLGHPINSNAVEFSLIVAPDGKTGYYASDNPEDNQGLTDLFSFELPEESQAEEIAYIKGKVINQNTREPIQAEIDFHDLEDGKLVLDKSSNRAGDYFAVLPANSDYALNIRKKGFLFYSRNFSLATQTADRAFILNVELVPIEIGQKVKLENVFFATDSYELDHRSHSELDEVVKFLKENSSVEISLEGHTDNQGNSAYNKTLSKNRANSVMDYLVNNGIDKNRLSSAGYGDTQPVATNENAEGRQLNRRTELKITAY